MKKDPTEFRLRFKAWKNGLLVYLGGRPTDLYLDTMEGVARLNADNWGVSEDEALVHALNDNTYDYRGYYDKYPESSADSRSHWTDEFKTVYHPTFSDESKYHGKKSLYNPSGLRGGMWIGDKFLPATWQGLRLGDKALHRYKGGKDEQELPEGFLFDTNMPELTVYGDVERARRQNNWLINRGLFPRFYSLGNGKGVKEIKTPTEKGLEIVSPEFYVFGGLRPGGDIIAPITKNQLKSIGKAVIRQTAKHPTVTPKNVASMASEVTHFYHGSPVRFDAFSADFIGSGEGGSKVMKGINLWPKEKIGNAPKFANIKSPDAPLHLGVSSTPLGGELNPTVYDVSGKGLNLYKATPVEIKRLNQENLIKQGYDGVQTPNQVTVFPESINKLSIDKQSSIEDFVMSHPEIERWTPWTTDNQKMQKIINMSRMSRWTPEQWTAAQDAAIARGDMAEAQRLRDLHSTLTSTSTPGKYYRGTEVKRNTYPDRHIDEEVGEMNGIYLTKKPKYAKTYGDVEEFYLRSNNPLETEGSWTGVIDDATRAEIENAGYDAVINNRFDTGYLNRLLKNSRDETITFDGRNLKLADAVTYDNNGVRIPLGERDNFKVNDIRYGWVPWFLGGSATAALSSQRGYADGKDSGIHIKPSHRGKFTALKKRTGHSASWFKANGTPAQKKMATFELNARKWRH